MERVSVVDVATLCTFGSRHKLYQSLGNWSFLNGSIKRIGHKMGAKLYIFRFQE